jgi:hypothetical protein
MWDSDHLYFINPEFILQSKKGFFVVVIGKVYQALIIVCSPY